MRKKKQKESLIDKCGIWNWIRSNNLSLHFGRNPLYGSDGLNFYVSLYYAGPSRDSFIDCKVSDSSFDEALTKLFTANQGKTVIHTHEGLRGEKYTTKIVFPIIFEG